MTPVDHPIFARSGWQMSPGDRAALEGVVSALRPALAIEIGTAEGGSLERIAAHSGRVHAFDLETPARVPGNATFHEGDSKVTVPAALAELDDDVAFALVDGDHGTEGVRADLEALLGSPRVRETVILAHDAFNPGVRAGVESVLGHEKLTYADLDFVPGRLTMTGFFADQMWGGFALLLVGVPAPGVEIFGLDMEYMDAYEGAHRASEQLRPPRRFGLRRR